MIPDFVLIDSLLVFSDITVATVDSSLDSWVAFAVGHTTSALRELNGELDGSISLYHRFRGGRVGERERRQEERDMGLHFCLKLNAGANISMVRRTWGGPHQSRVERENANVAKRQ